MLDASAILGTEVLLAIFKNALQVEILLMDMVTKQAVTALEEVSAVILMVHASASLDFMELNANTKPQFIKLFPR